MPSYLVETHLARGLAGELTARESRARNAAESTEGRTRVRFQQSIHIPEDELCYFVFEAPSGREAALVAQRAGLDPLRVMEAVAPGTDETRLDRPRHGLPVCERKERQ